MTTKLKVRPREDLASVAHRMRELLVLWDAADTDTQRRMRGSLAVVNFAAGDYLESARRLGTEIDSCVLELVDQFQQILDTE